MMDNDANVAAVGEMWTGAGKGASHLLCLTLGTGIGAGVIINGKIYRGANGSAGESGGYCNRGRNFVRRRHSFRPFAPSFSQSGFAESREKHSDRAGETGQSGRNCGSCVVNQSGLSIWAFLKSSRPK